MKVVTARRRASWLPSRVTTRFMTSELPAPNPSRKETHFVCVVRRLMDERLPPSPPSLRPSSVLRRVRSLASHAALITGPVICRHLSSASHPPDSAELLALFPFPSRPDSVFLLVVFSLVEGHCLLTTHDERRATRRRTRKKGSAEKHPKKQQRGHIVCASTRKTEQTTAKKKKVFYHYTRRTHRESKMAGRGQRTLDQTQPTSFR